MTKESIVGDFIHSYRDKSAEESDAVWLTRTLGKYDAEDGKPHRDGVSKEIQDGIANYRHSTEELKDWLDQGKSRTSYLESAILTAAKAEGVANIAQYAAKIDQAVSHANQMMWDTVHRLDGGVNQASTLHGNIAEAFLAGESGINQAVNESSHITIQPRVNTKGSADTVVVDPGAGRIVSCQQMKFYPTPEATLKAYLDGPYRENGQCLVAPADQVARIHQLRPDIDVRASIDGRSAGLTFDDALDIQGRVQEKGEVFLRDWSSADAGVISRHIGARAVESGILAMGFQAARIAGRRFWNAMTGLSNKSVEEDLGEFGVSALKSGTNAGMVTALAGGLEVAARRGLMGEAIKAASPCVIANLACIAVENIRIFGELGDGKITSRAALDKSCNNTCALLGSLAVGSEFAAAVGTAFLPGVGTAVGAVVGGMVGSVGGQTIYRGAKAAVKAVGNFVSRVATSVRNVASRAWSSVKSWFA